MAKKRKKQRVRIIAYTEYRQIPGLQVTFKHFVSDVSYESSVFVSPSEDVWEVIGKELDSKFYAMLQEEREV